MSRVVMIVDSATGSLVGADGRTREGARYKKLAKRMLSLGNPAVLDYGGNGASKMEISNGGYAGDEIVLKAKSVKIAAGGGQDATLTVNGSTIEEMIAAGGSVSTLLGKIKGTEGQIDADIEDNSSNPGEDVLRIGLSQDVIDKLDQIDPVDTGAFVSKAELAQAISGISFTDGMTLEDVKGMLQVLVGRLAEIAGGGS